MYSYHSFDIIDPTIYQRMAHPPAHVVAGQATNSKYPRAEGDSINWITEGLFLT